MMINKIINLDRPGKTHREIMAAIACMSETELTANIIFRIIKPPLEAALATEKYFHSDLRNMPRAELQNAADLVVKEIIALIRE